MKLSRARSAHLPQSLMNRYGDDIEFGAHGHDKDYRIDSEALAAHLVVCCRQE